MTYTKAEYDNLKNHGVEAQDDYLVGVQINTNQVLNSILALLEKNDRTAKILPASVKSNLDKPSAPARTGAKTVASTPRGSRKKSKGTAR
tara:strand:+ start:2612 stop:2881 length:270 start_codon:yes stop_codon:yes gene_type:complete